LFVTCFSFPQMHAYSSPTHFPFPFSGLVHPRDENLFSSRVFFFWNDQVFESGALPPGAPSPPSSTRSPQLVPLCYHSRCAFLSCRPRARESPFRLLWGAPHALFFFPFFPPVFLHDRRRRFMYPTGPSFPLPLPTMGSFRALRDPP